MLQQIRVYSACMWRAALLLLGILGCASSSSGPVFHDDNYLRFGVDPDAEANAVIESQKERDYRLARRMDGRHFAALGFMDRGGRSRAVRILTVRGIAVALDSRPQSPIQPAANYALISSPLAETYDADGDGFEEVFVEERTANEACLRVFRVRDVGFVDPVVVDSLVLGQEICPHAAIDLDGDGVVELTTELDLVGFPGTGAIVPRMHLPLWADQHRFVARAGSAAQRAWLGRERARLDAELQRARQRLDVSRCYFIGIELAALAYLERSDPAAQLAAFDRALGGMVLTPPQAAANLRARSHIYTDWNDPKRVAARSAVAALQSKETREPAARQLNASKTAPASEPAAARRVRRVAPRAQPQLSAPLATPLDPDEPILAEGEFVITPESAAQDANRRAARGRRQAAPLSGVDAGTQVRQRTAPLRAADAGGVATQTAVPLRAAGAADKVAAPQSVSLRAAGAGRVPPQNVSPPPAAVGKLPPPPSVPLSAAGAATAAMSPTAPLPAADDVSAFRAAARELGNAAVAERALAATARQAAAAERVEAQAARVRAMQAGDPAIAAEHRKAVADHIAAAQRYAEESNEHAAAASQHRAALAEHKARLNPVPSEAGEGVAAPAGQERAEQH
jgi:hypothetical protein